MQQLQAVAAAAVVGVVLKQVLRLHHQVKEITAVQVQQAEPVQAVAVLVL
jgi:uncharacterized membrane protein (DUF4010 family)